MATDIWADWLLSRRDGGDEQVRRRYAPALEAFRDGVLDRAAIRDGDVLLDLGTGSGLIGLGALDRVGLGGRVIFSDVSADLLAECRRAAGDDPRCEFRLLPADDLGALADASVDVVTSRSVLMYVAARDAAIREIRRVLRPGGRLSLFEPINSFLVGRNPNEILGLDLSPVADLVAKIRSAYAAERVIVDFDERDLLGAVERAGFTAIEMDHRVLINVPARGPVDWDALKRTAPNPLVPTYQEAMEAQLTAAERDRLEELVRALLAAGAARRTSLATVFLRAVVAPD